MSGRERNVTLRLRLEPSSAARSGIPLRFFAEHRLDIVQTLAICRSSPFNGRGGAPRVDAIDFLRLGCSV